MLNRLVLAWLFVIPSAHAMPLFDLTSVIDPDGRHAALYDTLTMTIAAAGQHWGQHLNLPDNGRSIEVEVTFSAQYGPTASAASYAATPIGTTREGHLLWQQGVASELITGIDPNGLLPDMTIVLNPEYATDVLWWDDDPYVRKAPVPADKVDGTSVMLHEIGHALGFNGFLDSDGTRTTNVLSTFDQYVIVDADVPYFIGAAAVDVYGGPVPLTVGNLYHVGNFFGRPGYDIIDDVMSGARILQGLHHDISPLDVAILHDVGFPFGAAAVGEPGSFALALLVFGGLLAGNPRSMSLANRSLCAHARPIGQSGETGQTALQSQGM